MHTTQPLRVLVLDAIHKSGLDVLRRETEVTVLPGLSGDVLATAIGDYHAIIVNSDTNLTTQLINRAHQLQVIGVVGARLDRIDVHTVYAHNIEIVDVHNYAANAVAEQTLRLLLGLNVPLAGHTLGIIGFGRTGNEVARRARAFDMRIVANQPLPTLELAITDDVEMLNLPNLLAQADFISLHVPGQPTTPALLTGEHLAHLKPGAHFLNLSCSNLIDPAALLAALDDDRLAGAVLTVHPDDTPLPKALRAHARMQLIPPVEATADEVERDMAVTLAQRVLQALRTYKSGNQLNLKIAPIERVLPHEHYDPERVAALAARLANEETLINPPVVVQTEDHYIVLDGATRSQAFRQLGYPHVAVQVVDPDDDGLELYHWNHALSDVTTAQLLGRLQRVGEMQWEKTDKPTAETMLSNRKALCYLVTSDEQ